MQIELFSLRSSAKGFQIGYGRVGSLYGEVMVDKAITEPGAYEVKTRLVVKAGRLVVDLLAVKGEANG